MKEFCGDIGLVLGGNQRYSMMERLTMPRVVRCLCWLHRDVAPSLSLRVGDSVRIVINERTSYPAQNLRLYKLMWKINHFSSLIYCAQTAYLFSV